jgi:hypothetical protein
MSTVGSAPFRVLVDDQDVDDIIQALLSKHVECERAYDLIYTCFDGPGSWMDVADRLFTFLKENCTYQIESDKWQYVSSPQVLLTRGVCDCKGYALFIAGVIDAMRRSGEQVDWTYRFASYNLLNRVPGHVFVVLFPGTKNEIWIDPVLDHLNGRWPRPMYSYDYVPVKRMKAEMVAGLQVSGQGRIGLSGPEQGLLNALKQYSDGIGDAVNYTRGQGVLNTITLAIVQGISYIPVVGQVLSLLKAAGSLISNSFGPGSLAARLVNDWANNPLTAPVKMVEDIFNGRTYQSDQYEAAGYYQFYVLGNSKVTKTADIPDSGVFPALKWFMDRLGIFISGAEHIQAITRSPQAYTALAAVNSYTTTDLNRVNAAYNVASRYFIFNKVPGEWQNTVGVYDELLIGTAQAMNESVEAAAAQADYKNVYSSTASEGPAPVNNGPQLPVLPLILGVGALLLILTPSTHGKKSA